MKISLELKRRFCKDNNIALQIYDEPYFTERLKLYGYWDRWLEFLGMYEQYFNCNENRYFEYYSKLKDSIIEFIKNSEAFNLLNNDKDILEETRSFNIKQSDVYKIPNIGKRFISIDMKKANFSALVHYSKNTNTEFFESYDWNEFMKQFTDIEYFYNCKYIRQVVFGNCNPKRQVAYEKKIMIKLLSYLIDLNAVELKDVYSLCNDEIIISGENLDKDKIDNLINLVNKFSSENVPLEIENFVLGKIIRTDGFIKKVLDFDGEEIDLKLKCLSPYEIPFVLRKLKDLPSDESDTYFVHNDRLAKYITNVDIEFCFEKTLCPEA